VTRSAGIPAPYSFFFLESFPLCVLSFQLPLSWRNRTHGPGLYSRVGVCTFRRFCPGSIFFFSRFSLNDLGLFLLKWFLLNFFPGCLPSFSRAGSFQTHPWFQKFSGALMLNTPRWSGMLSAATEWISVSLISPGRLRSPRRSDPEQLPRPSEKFPKEVWFKRLLTPARSRLGTP